MLLVTFELGDGELMATPVPVPGRAGPAAPTAGASPAAALAQLHTLMSGLHRGLDLRSTLVAIADCVVAGLDFGAGVISMIEPDGSLRVAAVAGNEQVRASLSGSRSTRAQWDLLLAAGEPVGPSRLLRLVDHQHQQVWEDAAMHSWVPPQASVSRRPGDDREAWHPEDALFAPLVSPTGVLLGVLSVDLPGDGLRPGPEQLGLLEMFVVQAAVALEHARLHTEVLAAKEQARSALAARLQAVVDASPLALIEVDRAGVVREWNRAAEELFGYRTGEVVGRPLPPLAAGAELDVGRLLRRLHGGGQLSRLQLRGRHRNGAEIEVEVSAAATRTPDGTVGGVMGLLVDVTERNRLAATLRHQATHDALTGLPNRLLVGQLLQQALLDTGSCTGVLLVDLDRFKDVNDTLGHSYGDLLLQAVGPRLAGVLRPGDVLARLSGDEFAVLLPGLPDAAAAAGVGGRVLQALHEPFDLAGVCVDMEASIGVSVAPRDGTDPVRLMRQADVAMYEAKDTCAGVVSYRPERERRIPGRLALFGELRRALDGDELVMHYQPQVDIASGGFTGLEALVRWQHPVRGLLTPADFLAVAEATGLVNRLTMRTLGLVLTQLRCWLDAGLEPPPVAVNLSARCLSDPDLPDAVAATLLGHGVPARLLRLELTESSVMSDPESALTVLRGLAANGIRLSIDDFGTGYSSMSYLRQLPVDELKVDRSFVTGLAAAGSDRVLVRSAVDLGHNLGMTVVAEGVEDAATLDVLAELGCDTAQGYLLGRPMPALGLLAWWQRHDARSAAAGQRV